MYQYRLFLMIWWNYSKTKNWKKPIYCYIFYFKLKLNNIYITYVQKHDLTVGSEVWISQKNHCVTKNDHVPCIWVKFLTNIYIYKIFSLIHIFIRNTQYKYIIWISEIASTIYLKFGRQRESFGGNKSIQIQIRNSNSKFHIIYSIKTLNEIYER